MKYKLETAKPLGAKRTLRAGIKRFAPLIVPERRLFGRRVGGIEHRDFIGAGLAEDVISALEARALWARYGL